MRNQFGKLVLEEHISPHEWIHNRALGSDELDVLRDVTQAYLVDGHILGDLEQDFRVHLAVPTDLLLDLGAKWLTSLTLVVDDVLLTFGLFLHLIFFAFSGPFLRPYWSCL